MRALRKAASRRRLLGAGSTSTLLAALVAAVAVAAETRTVSFVSAGGNGPFEAEYAGASADGSRIFFETEESLAAADTNGTTDVYEGADGTSKLVSAGPGGTGLKSGGSFGGTSADGSRVFFETEDSLVAEDEDESTDIYEAHGEALTLISVGPAGGNGAFGAYTYFVSDDGQRVIFWTNESLVAADEDESRDVYERAAGVTTLISTGPEDTHGAGDSTFAGAATEGKAVFFYSDEALVPEDEDESTDIYERAEGATALLSVGPSGGNGEQGVGGARVSADGSRVFFETIESLVEADGDGQRDAYERFGGVTSLVTTGASGNAGQVAYLHRISRDGSRAVFHTYGSLDPADTDTSEDVYERSGGVTTLVSTGPAGGNGDFDASPRGIAPEGDRVFFVTEEPLTAVDTDEAADLYERSGGVTTLVSTGPAGGNGDDDAAFEDVSADGRRVYFNTAEALVAADTDGDRDVYERFEGVTTLISTSPEDGGGGGGSYLSDLTADDAHAILETYESLVAADEDEEYDLYVSTLDPSGPEPEPESSPPTAAPAPAPEPPGGGDADTPRCLGKPATIVGTGRRDVLKGTRKRDVIVARGGNDKILAFGGNDLICAGRGKDMVKAGNGNDRVAAGAGADRVFGQGGNDRVLGQGGNDLLFGNAGRDLLNGGARKDRCRGGGKDRLRRCER